MSPTTAIINLRQLKAQIGAKVDDIHVECMLIEQQWAGLGNVLAQRDESAAKLLQNLKKPLASLASKCATIMQQIENIESHGESNPS